MGSAAESAAGPERWIFWAAATMVVVLDLVTKIVADQPYDPDIKLVDYR